MDQDDPEKRTTDGRGLAQRRLLAHARPSDKQVRLVGWGLVGLLLVLFGVAYKLVLVVPAVRSPWGPPVLTIFPMLLVAVCAYIARRRLARPIVIWVTSDGLTMNQRPGDVFSFSDAKLGAWDAKARGGGTTAVGRALHTQCGSHRFVLGAEGHRVTPGTKLDAPPTRSVDATVTASDFDELLATVRSARGE